MQALPLHRYSYDAENRLTEVYSGRDSVMLFLFPEREAKYQYYKHGPLARMELGQLRVQGLDYAYTLQGWLKAVNPAMSGTLTNGTDTTEAYPVAQDAYAFSLHYYKNDYKAIGFTAQSTSVLGALGTNASPLYNGNIAAMAVNLPKLGATKLYNYHYDQLNRIVSMDVFNGLSGSAGTFTPVSVNDYKERISYDPNGNILTYKRNGDAARLSMDSINYHYTPHSNRLHKVVDDAADASQPQYSNYNDIRQGQSDNNYQYDAIGNMVSDQSEGISSITWSVYGKILTITKSGSQIKYIYDASGNRIMKYTSTDTTVYVRDASGNVMSVYSRPAGGVLSQSETHLYGNSRLGMATKHVSPDSSLVLSTGFGSGLKVIFTRGEKLFELSNHLGNVLVTVSDKRIQVGSGGSVTHYLGDYASVQDYYPFGMGMPGRKWSSGLYRYGFNGKENDNEVKGEANQQDYGMRIYDPRTAKFYSVDPLARSFSDLTPYQFAGNSPLRNIDLDGGEPKDYRDNWVYKPIIDVPTGERAKAVNVEDVALGVIQYHGIFDKVTQQHWLVTEKAGRHYYWKPNPGEDQTRRYVKGNTTNGSWVEYETAEAQRARVHSEAVDFLSVFFAVNIAGAIASGGGIYGWAYRIIAEDVAEELAGVPVTPWRLKDIFPKSKYATVTRNSDEINSTYNAKGWESPWKKGSTVTEMTTTKNIELVRLSHSENVPGDWFTTASEIKGLTPAQLKDKFSLPYLPTHVTPVTIHAGATIRIGEASSIEKFGTGGGGYQIEKLSGNATYGQSQSIN